MAQLRIPQEGMLHECEPATSSQGGPGFWKPGLWDAKQVGWRGWCGLGQEPDESPPSRAWTGQHVPEVPLASQAMLSPRDNHRE